MPRYLMAMDVGGTFLDTVVVDDDGRVITTKVLSSHEDYTRCIRQAVETVSEQLGHSVEEFLSHTRLSINGTTVATNILAEFKGQTVGLVTTRGFGDTLQIARISRWNTFDVHHLEPLPQLVARDDIVEVDERVDRNGDVVVAIDRAQVEAAVRHLVEVRKVDALVVSFLWSFRNPRHEELVREVAREVAPDLPVTLSSVAYPVMREYERTNIAVIDAFIAPGAALRGRRAALLRRPRLRRRPAHGALDGWCLDPRRGAPRSR